MNRELDTNVQATAEKTMRKWSLMSGDYIKLIAFTALVIGRGCKMNERSVLFGHTAWLVTQLPAF